MTTTLISFIKGVFGSEERANCDVRFYQGGSHGVPECETSDKWLSAKIPGHLLVLAPQSKRLQAQADNPWWPQQQDGSPEQRPTKKARNSPEGDIKEGAVGDLAPAAVQPLGRPLLAVPLDGPHEVESATNVLKYMYQAQLSPGLSLQQLLMTRKLAEYLLCSECAEACATALAVAPAPSAEEAYAVLTEPDLACMLDDAAVSSFVGACAAALAQMLGSTLAVARSEALGAKFLRLPAVALHKLLSPDGSGKLPVDSEETVLLLLTRWALCNTPPTGVALQLRKLLRPLQLCPTYLHHVLPKLEWLGLTRQDLADLTFAAHVFATAPTKTVKERRPGAVMVFGDLYRVERQWLDLRVKSDHQDFAAAAAAASTQETISATWSREELRAMQQEAQRDPASGSGDCFGPYVYWRGFEWCISVQVGAIAAAEAAQSSGGSAQQWEAGLFIEHRMPPAFEQACARGAAVLSKVVLQVDLARGRFMPHQLHDYFIRPYKGLGSHDLLMKQGALDPAAWEPFLVDGAMRVRAVMTV